MNERQRERDRNRDQHDSRFAPAEHQPDQRRDREHREQHVPQQFVALLGGGLAVVAGDGEVHVGRHQRCPSACRASAITRCATSMALVPLRLATAIVTAGCAPDARDWKVTYDVGSASPSTTSATSRTNTGRPLATLTTTSRTSSAVRRRLPASRPVDLPARDRARRGAARVGAGDRLLHRRADRDRRRRAAPDRRPRAPAAVARRSASLPTRRSTSAMASRSWAASARSWSSP